MKGTIANAAAIVAGSGIGLLLQKGIPDRFKTTIMQGISLTVLLIGIQMAQKTENILIVIGSMVLGAVLGEWWDLDKRLCELGNWLELKSSDQPGNISKGFVTCSLVYCVGAMAVVGSIQDGLTGNAEVLYAKSMLDGIASIIFASTLGLGVTLSAASVLVYQGFITLLANYIGVLATPGIINEMTATGGVLIIGLALSMLEIRPIKVANLLPAIFVAIGIAAVIK
jgi:uncharacterized protein